MGKKTKIGKSRKDKFYHLAKDTGYRCRAAFKLIQLNKKYGFLNQSRVVIDLCAAPGGWMQVVAENAPVSSLIVGVDLVPIRPVQGCVSMQEDITTDKCRQNLKKTLQTWQADCVLHDGAPNVGKNWNHDAYNQSELTLHALKLATEFLRKGGWFVTKVFRSKDYFALDWVFKQLFKKVWATKPQASRNESAEIFVVCENFIAPDKLDPKFLDPKHVFNEVADTPLRLINLMHPEKKQRHREGYAEGDYTQFHKLNASEFINSDSFLDKLAASSMIELDEEAIANSKHTTSEIKECCQDLRVLGKKEIKSLLQWRKLLLKEQQKAQKEEAARIEKEIAVEVDEEEKEEESDIDIDEKELTELLENATEENRKIQKRKDRKERKLRAKKQQRIDLKLDIPGDRLDIGENESFFSLTKIRTKQNLDKVQEGDLSFMDGDIVEDDDDEEAQKVLRKRKLMEAYDRDTKKYIDSSEYPSDEEGLEEPSLMDMEDIQAGSDEDFQDDKTEEGSNDLLVDFETAASKTASCVGFWFGKSSLDQMMKSRSLDNDKDLQEESISEDEEINAVENSQNTKKVRFELNKFDDDSDGDDDDEDRDEDGDQVENEDQDNEDDDDDDDSEDESKPVAENPNDLKLDPVGLAMATQMVSSKKRKRELVEFGYNKYMGGDGEDLPDWFVNDERKHRVKQMPVTKEEVQEHMLKMRAINARPIKKIAEAKAKKRRKMTKRLEKARKKAEAVNESGEVSEKEKIQMMKNIYKKAGLLGQKKKETTYVVAKKGSGKRVSRPKGVTGHYKVVDPRMKKDNRAEKASNKKKGGKGKKGGKQGKKTSRGQANNRRSKAPSGKKKN